MVIGTSLTTGTAGTGAATSLVGSALSLTNPISSILTGLNQVEALFGLNSSDPARDQERINRINYAYDLAMRGDTSPQTSTSPNTNLNGMSGADYLQYIATNDGGRGDPPVYGSQIARRYAQAKYAEYQARLAAGQIGIGLIGQSTIPGQIQSYASSALVWVLVIAGVIAVVWYARKKGR